MYRFDRVTILLLMSTLLLFEAGCAASGAAFQSIGQTPEGKALVYIYRPNSMLGGAIRYHVAVGDERIVYLIRGGYFPYLADPGETEFWARTEAKTSVSENLRAGQTYYLKGGVGVGLGVGRPKLEFVSEEAGKPQVEKCVLLPPAEGVAK